MNNDNNREEKTERKQKGMLRQADLNKYNGDMLKSLGCMIDIPKCGFIHNTNYVIYSHYVKNTQAPFRSGQLSHLVQIESSNLFITLTLVWHGSSSVSRRVL